MVSLPCKFLSLLNILKYSPAVHNGDGVKVLFKLIRHYQTCLGLPTIFHAGSGGSLRRMDTCVHCLEFETDVCSEELKNVKEQGDLGVFQPRLITYDQIK